MEGLIAVHSSGTAWFSYKGSDPLVVGDPRELL